jgi:cystathionine beta-lyase/cystathionine gamma-synthase
MIRRSFHGFVNPPVVHASTVLFPDAQAMVTRNQRYTYGTRGTPTTDALNSAIDELEGSAGTVALPSGLAAVTLPFMATLSAGDHVAGGRFGLCADAQPLPTACWPGSASRRPITIPPSAPTSKA